MNDATKTKSSAADLARAHNDGVRRGRMQQIHGQGYLVPVFLTRGPADILKAYETGWSKGFERVTRVDLLLAAVPV